MLQRPYWWDTVSIPDTGVVADALGRHFDVAIVGAGYTGLSAARALAKGGARVLVIDRDGVGAGASSRNAGQVLTGLKPAPGALVQRYGEAQARALFDASTAAMHRLEALVSEERIACEFTRCGHLQAAARPAHFAAFQEERALLARVFDHCVELVPAGEQRREIGSDRYHGLLIDEASASINPAQYVAGLARAAAGAGALICAHTAVVRLARAERGWRVGTASGALEATHVLIATNGYVSALTPSLQRRFMPVGSYSVVTEPLDETVAATLLPHGRMAFDSKHFLYYFRLTSDRRLLFGGRAEFGIPTAESGRRAAEILRRAIGEVFPVLADVRIDYAWEGNVAFTRDQLPHAGRLDGLWFAGGYGGHGIAMATRFGELMAARIGGAAAADPLFELPCPTIPLLRDRPWFLPLVGAYYRMKDWLG